MSLSPIRNGRLPGSLLSQRLWGHIQRDQFELSRLQDMASTGQRFFRPGESPAASAQTIYLQKEIERNAQLVKNVATDASLLSATETALHSVGDALTKLKTYVAAGVGDSTTPAEKQALALEVRALLQDVLQSANSTYRGRSLFGGALTSGVAFEEVAGGAVRYNGDPADIDSQVGSSFLMTNNVDGATAFEALSTPITHDLDPALALATRLSDLRGGAGIPLGPIRVTVDDGVNPAVTVDVDLAGAETAGDLKTRLEAAFSPGPPGLAVAVNATGDGFRLTPTAGTVAVSDIGGGLTADALGLRSAPVATLNGTDVDPVLTPSTRLADLNGGAGVDLAGGLRITSGDQAATIDLTGAVTVEDALNAIRSQAKAAGIDVSVGLTEDGTGIAVSSRVAGAGFGIGENGGSTAEGLGLRTLTTSTRLSDLNRGLGIPTGPSHRLEITRRNGATVSIDLPGASTIQDVLDAINAIDPGNLVASPNATGNGISLVDGGGTGPLSVAANELSLALGMAGTEAGNDPTVALVGSDVNPQDVGGIMNLMVRLEQALRAGNDRELNRLAPLIDAEFDRFSEVRGDVAARLRTLDEAENRLKDREISLKGSLKDVFEIDVAEVLTQVTYRQATLEATLRISAQTMSLSLINYL